MPDYVNMQTVNRITTASGSWKNDQGNGFVSIKFLQVNNATFKIVINGSEVAFAGSGATSNSYGIVLPIKNNDTIDFQPKTNTFSTQCHFIPPLSTGKRIETIPINNWRRTA